MAGSASRAAILRPDEAAHAQQHGGQLRVVGRRSPGYVADSYHRDLRSRAASPPVVRLPACQCVHLGCMATFLAAASARFRMRWQDAFGSCARQGRRSGHQSCADRCLESCAVRLPPLLQRGRAHGPELPRRALEGSLLAPWRRRIDPRLRRGTASRSSVAGRTAHPARKQVRGLNHDRFGPVIGPSATVRSDWSSGANVPVRFAGVGPRFRNSTTRARKPSVPP